MGYSSSSPAPYGPTGGHTPTTPTMMSSPQDANGGEMQPYSMRTMPPGPAPMVLFFKYFFPILFFSSSSFMINI